MTKTSVIAGLGAWTPPKRLSNADLSAILDTSDEWIVTRTGISQRHVIEPGMSTGTLAVEAGRAALRSAGTTTVDVVVVATSTPDRVCPATAPAVASALGLSGTAAFDVAAVCTGFVYALAVAHGLICGGVAATALVIGADSFSTIMDPDDRTTRVIFGDAAGAVVLRAGSTAEDGALLGFDLGSDGSGKDLITVPAGGSEQRAHGLAAEAGQHYFQMQGKAVFPQAVYRMSESTKKVVDQVGWTLEDVDKFVAHQANKRILSAYGEELGIDPSKTVGNIERVGNTVAASIPLALRDAHAAGELRHGDRVVLAGFGGGLTWGAAALRWPDIAGQNNTTEKNQGVR